jgi:hypothetical protein
MTQGLIKQGAEEGVDKVQDCMKAETFDQILQKELEVKEKSEIEKATFDEFMAHWKQS